jgi:hypothetical protein
VFGQREKDLHDRSFVIDRPQGSKHRSGPTVTGAGPMFDPGSLVLACRPSGREANKAALCGPSLAAALLLIQGRLPISRQ